MTVNEIYDMLKSFVGYGNPSSNYWFFGMEENWSFDCAEDITKIITLNDIEYYSSEVQPLNSKSYAFCKFLKLCKKSGTFENGIKKILEILEKKSINCDDLHSMFFSSNVKFLPDSKEDEIKRMFLLDDSETHLKSEEERREKIYLLWKSAANPKRVTFCLSIGYEQLFCNMFSVDFTSDEDNPRIKYGQMENGEYIILFAHPSSRKHFPVYLAELKLFLPKIS